MDVLFNKKFLNYNESSNYEGAYRLQEFVNNYRDSDIDYEPKKDILAVHSERYYRKIKGACNNKNELVGLQLTPETFEIAKLAVSYAIKASESEDFAVIRPPGHHADREKASGFCLFNNMAIAATKLLKNGKRVAVLDLDGHHGDGTQNLLENKENVFFCSIHEQDVFPGTGYDTKNNYENFPLTKPILEEKYINTLDSAIQKLVSFNPDILGVSIGFDTFKNDKLLDFQLDKSTYRHIGMALKMNFNRIFAILEGGYHDNIFECIQSFIAGVNSAIN